MVKRRRGVSLVALPFVSLVWLVGWVLYCLGSSGQRLARGGKKPVAHNVPVGLRLNVSRARLSAGSNGLIREMGESAWSRSSRSVS